MAKKEKYRNYYCDDCSPVEVHRPSGNWKVAPRCVNCKQKMEPVPEEKPLSTPRTVDDFDAEARFNEYAQENMLCAGTEEYDAAWAAFCDAVDQMQQFLEG